MPRISAMKVYAKISFVIFITICVVALAGCVERKLTINTQPQGAVVFLNDEEIGSSPATVSFQWYGDYNITARKDGYETLKTHRKLEAPRHDAFPYDFFAQLLTPKRIVDSYEWTFELEPKKALSTDDLVQKAEILKEQMQ
jgi:hypothetical protein